MPVVRILSGGAAQGLVAALAPGFEAASGHRIEGTFGAVGAMAAKLRAGAPADLLILTRRLIDDLAAEGFVASDARADVGTVETAVAVRAGDPVPAIEDAAGLRDALLAADEIFFPDPEQATAGIHFAGVLRSLGILDAVAARQRTFPNGAAAMRALAAAGGRRPIGCTQATEILNTPGLTLVGPLPRGCDLATVYTGAVCAGAKSPDAARALLERLTAAETAPQRTRAGFR